MHMYVSRGALDVDIMYIAPTSGQVDHTSERYWLALIYKISTNVVHRVLRVLELVSAKERIKPYEGLQEGNAQDMADEKNFNTSFGIGIQ